MADSSDSAYGSAASSPSSTSSLGSELDHDLDHDLDEDSFSSGSSAPESPTAYKSQDNITTPKRPASPSSTDSPRSLKQRKLLANYEKVVEEGDLIISLAKDGSEAEPYAQFLVCSQVLIVASPYFNAMFGPSSTFSEREKLNKCWKADEVPTI